MENLIGDGGDGQEESGANGHSQRKGADAKGYLVDDFVLPREGQELLVAVATPAPDIKEAAAAQEEEDSSQHQDLEASE